MQSTWRLAARAIGPEGVVRGDLGVMGVGHGRDLDQFAYAAGVADVGLVDVGDAGLDGPPETPTGEQALAGGDGDGGRGLDLPHGLDVFGQAGLLDEDRVRPLQLPA